MPLINFPSHKQSGNTILCSIRFHLASEHSTGITTLKLLVDILVSKEEEKALKNQ
jgi:hypothetical protein